MRMSKSRAERSACLWDMFMGGMCVGRFYKLACDGFLSIVPDVFVLHEGA